MKIGILTFTTGDNIGQRLQNYALQETLKKYADEVWTIKQTSPYSLLSNLKIFIKMCFLGVKYPRNFVKVIKRNKLFSEFNNRYIRFYKRKINFYGNNEWISKKIDAFVVGSDQIWNPNSPDVGKNFFLEFANPRQRFTYAPSFSVEEIPQSRISEYEKWLSGFDDLSIREDRGAEIIEKIVGKRGTVVLDPTLLVKKEIWDNIKEEFPRKKKKGYVLCVFLGGTKAADIKEFEKQELIEIRDNTPISPAQFIDLIENATIVLTDSYHASVFSIIYHVPFAVFTRQGTSNNMNSRFATLYRETGIGNRNWSYLQKNLNKIEEIDFSEVDKNIEIQRKDSIEFLNRTIGLFCKKEIKI